MEESINETTDYEVIDQQFWEYFEFQKYNDDYPENTSYCFNKSNVSESSDVTGIPAPEQSFVLIVYSVLLVIGAFGNVAVFTLLVRSRRRKSRVNLLMTHLTVADLIVIFFVIPLEIGWKSTNAWLAGNFACKFFLVLRAFGLYLSSNVLVCISLDRFFAVLYPLRLPIARKRSKTMLSFAWFAALICSVPQSFVFRVMQHPKVPEFQQCVSFDAFSSQRQELAYNVFCLCAMYFLPLFIITVCYLCIFYEISRNSNESCDKCSINDSNTRIHLRRSDKRPLVRARRRTLRMTVTIVSVFACCWLPYATMTLWYMLDRQSAKHVSARIQDVFFIMAVSNSCMDPLVYGSYVLDLRDGILKALWKMLCNHQSSSALTVSAPDSPGNKDVSNLVKLPNYVIEKRASHHHRFHVKFEETSFAGPSHCSDPSPNWNNNEEIEAIPLRLNCSRSCEIFTIKPAR